MKKRMVVLMASAAMMMLSGMTVSASENLDNVVDTSYGKVQGINSTDEGYEDVVQFKGVPYAAPPVGDLRWKAPVDHEKWDDILVCDTNREMPMQELGFVEPSGTDFHNNTAPEMSEDCLYLNISTTEENLTSDEKKPVYVWFHGGGLTVGHTYSAEGNLDAFAENDVIAVSVEQRLGVFGYLSLPQLSEEQGQSGNYGLMDQIKALEWIKENIANFGGDPENITVGGQSGGTMKAMSMIASPQMDVDVDKLILESGLKYVGAFQSQEDAEKKVLEYNTRVLADVLSRYLEEERENGIVSRSVVREIMATAVGDPDNPLSGRIDGTSLDETWITYINVGSQSENYGGFTLEWNGYEAKYTPGQAIKITNQN